MAFYSTKIQKSRNTSLKSSSKWTSIDPSKKSNTIIFVLKYNKSCLSIMTARAYWNSNQHRIL